MPTTRMASEPAEQRTPLRAVQPDAVAAHEGEAVALEAKPVGGVIAGENDENFDSVRAAGRSVTTASSETPFRSSR